MSTATSTLDAVITTVTCGSCGTKLSASVTAEPKTIKCTRCGANLRVQLPAAPPAAPPPPPTPVPAMSPRAAAPTPAPAPAAPTEPTPPRTSSPAQTPAPPKPAAPAAVPSMPAPRAPQPSAPTRAASAPSRPAPVPADQLFDASVPAGVAPETSPFSSKPVPSAAPMAATTRAPARPAKAHSAPPSPVNQPAPAKSKLVQAEVLAALRGSWDSPTPAPSAASVSATTAEKRFVPYLSDPDFFKDPGEPEPAPTSPAAPAPRRERAQSSGALASWTKAFILAAAIVVIGAFGWVVAERFGGQKYWVIKFACVAFLTGMATATAVINAGRTGSGGKLIAVLAAVLAVVLGKTLLLCTPQIPAELLVTDVQQWLRTFVKLAFRPVDPLFIAVAMTGSAIRFILSAPEPQRAVEEV